MVEDNAGAIGRTREDGVSECRVGAGTHSCGGGRESEVVCVCVWKGSSGRWEGKRDEGGR